MGDIHSIVYTSMHECMYVLMHACMYVHMHESIHVSNVCSFVHIYTRKSEMCNVQKIQIYKPNLFSLHLILTWPPSFSISAVIEANKELLPAPTFPVIPINCP